MNLFDNQKIKDTKLIDVAWLCVIINSAYYFNKKIK